MKIKLKSNLAATWGRGQAGETIKVEDDFAAVAQVVIDAGYAEIVEPAGVAPQPEAPAAQAEPTSEQVAQAVETPELKANKEAYERLQKVTKGQRVQKIDG